MGSNAAGAASLLNRLATGAVVLGTGVSLAQASFYTVDGGERAVLFDRLQGVLNETQSEGMHFLVRATASQLKPPPSHPHPTAAVHPHPTAASQTDASTMAESREPRVAVNIQSNPRP